MTDQAKKTLRGGINSFLGIWRKGELGRSSYFEKMALLACAYLMFAFFTGFRPRPFLFDDNFTQWNSVAEYGFSELLSGHFPYWVPYQWAGFRIDEVGYYGIYNPAMFVAYLLRLTGISDMMTLYVFLMYGLGILSAHALCVACDHNRANRILFPLAYGCSSGYLLHSAWYYVWSVFGMGSFLMYGLYGILFSNDVRTRMRWSAINGASVALMFYLGNVQFACYLAWANYSVLGLFLLMRERTKRGILTGALSVCFAAVALLPLSQIYSQAAQGALFDGAPRMIAAPPVHAILGVFFHYEWVYALQEGASRFSLHGNAGGGVLAILAALFFLFNLKKNGHKKQNGFMLACWLTVACTLYLASGPPLLTALPVVHRFRMAFKYLFVIPPVLMAAAIIGAKYQSRKTTLSTTVLLFLSIGLSLGKTYSDDWGVTPGEVSLAGMYQTPHTPTPYRVAYGMWRGNGDDARPFGGQERKHAELLVANAGTSRRTPTLSGYNLSCPHPYIADMTALMGDAWYLGSGVLLDRLHDDPTKTMRLLQSYGVATLLVEKHDLDKLPPPLAPDLDHKVVPNLYPVPIPGALGLVSNSQGISKPYTLHADGISVFNVSENDTLITARWWPLRGFRVTFEGQDKILRGELIDDLFLKTKVPPHFSGTVRFTVFDRLSIACFIWAYILLGFTVYHMCAIHRLRPVIK